MEELFTAFAAEHPELPGLRAGLANLLAETPGREDDARVQFERLAATAFADVPRTWDWIGTMSTNARTCARLGDVRRARILYDLLLPHDGGGVPVGYGTGWDGAVAHHLGLLATVRSDFAAAERHFAAAERMHRTGGARSLLAQTQHERARMLLARGDDGDAVEARRLLREAARTYEAIGAAGRLADVRALAADGSAATVAPAPRANAFVRDGTRWCISFDGASVRLADTRGLRYLARLLETPEREVHVVELLGLAEAGAAATDSRPDRDGLSIRCGEDADPVLDARARADCRRRLAELRDEIADAERSNDLGRLERTRNEHAAVETELARAFGLFDRARRHDHAVERARKAVYNRIRAALAAIEAEHPALGRHLARSVTTGTYCAYRPDRRVAWRV
jgi:hypothetical protein